MTRQDGEGAAREKTDPSGQGTEGGGGVHCVWRRGLDSAWAGEIGGRRRGEKFAGLNTLNDTAHELIGPHVTVLPETPALSALRRRRTTNSSTSTRPLSSSTPHPSPPRHSPLQSPHVSAFASTLHQSVPFGIFEGIFGGMSAHHYLWFISHWFVRLSGMFCSHASCGQVVNIISLCARLVCACRGVFIYLCI